MNLLCALNGHRMGQTLLHMGEPGDRNYEVHCARCDHVEIVRYGDRPPGFGPRVYLHLRLRLRGRLR